MARHIVVADTDEAALAIARRGYRRWYASFMKLWLEHGSKPVGVVYPAEFDGEGANGRMIAGSPASVRDQLQAQIDESGANYVACRFAFGDLTFEESRRSVELFAEQVMPRLRAQRAGRRRIDFTKGPALLPIPVQFQGRLSIPAVAAPMFLVSNPDLVVEACRAGIIGTFPALNQPLQRRTTRHGSSRSASGSTASSATPAARPAPFGVNLIVHKSNPRLQADLEISIKHKVPLIITSLGAVKELVGAVQGYGGLVFHDVINMRHARKAAEAGVDGLIAVCAGAGGHAGLLSPFALIPEIRQFFPKTILLSGVMSTGRHIAAARMLGADLAYLGTRFIATRESMAQPAFKDMIVSTNATDIVYTAAISGVHGNFLRPSDRRGRSHRYRPCGDDQAARSEPREARLEECLVGRPGRRQHRRFPTTAELCSRLIREYREAMAEAAGDFSRAA